MIFSVFLVLITARILNGFDGRGRNKATRSPYDILAEIKINLDKNQINLTQLNLQLFAYKINLIANKKLALDDSIEFLTSNKSSNKSIDLLFLNIKDIYFRSKFLYDLQKKISISNINFFYSDFDVIANGSTRCLEVDDEYLNFFGCLESLGFAYTVRYFEKTCPLIFSNCELDLVEFNGMSDTFLKRNKLGFLPSKRTINSSIQSMLVNAYKIDLDESLLDANVFEKTVQIELKGRIGKINFAQLKNLITININVNNLEEFFFNNKNLVNHGNNFKILNIINKQYKFPDYDFCYFKSVYYINSIQLNILGSVQNCTCTLVLFFLSPDRIGDLTSFLIDSVCLNLTNKIETCKIRNKLFDCELIDVFRPSKLTSQDLVYSSEILNLSTIFITPILSLITIITNLINFKILFNIENRNKSASIKLMLINSAINIAYSFIYSVHLINKCVYLNGIFCSPILREKYSQIFDIVFVEFGLNVLKLWSNASILAISWLRLTLLIKKNHFLNRINLFKTEKSSRILVACILLIGVLISVDKLFVVRVNQRFFDMDEKDYEEFPNKNTFMIRVYREVGDHSINSIFYRGNVALIFYSLFLVNFFLNDFVMYCLLFVIDTSILYYLNKSVKRKKTLAKKLKKKEEKEIKETELMVNWTVGVNLFLFFLLKMGHFTVSFYVFIKKLFSNMGYENVCFHFSRVCSNYLEFSEILFVLSSAYSIVLFRNLNRKFKDSFDRIFNF